MQERENFASRLGFILVSAGCAVGLGNVWKFPYICGQNGGAIFILIYLAFLVLIALPVLISEFSVGRASKRSTAKAFDVLEPKNSTWHRFKYFGFIGNYLLMMFYTMVGGWMLYYAWLMMSGQLRGLTTEGVGNIFGGMLNSAPIMVFWMMLAIIIPMLICSRGLQKGVENVTKVMMFLLILLMVIMSIRSLTLENASEGLEFYLAPNLERFLEQGPGNVIFAAMSHAFFTLSVGMGSMAIFGSYLPKTNRLFSEAGQIAILDTVIALMAGLIIIPACFANGIAPDSGPSLLFLTLPSVFNKMGAGQFWGSCFFIFMSFAALSTIIAVFENIIAMSMEHWEISRKKAVIYNFIGITLLSLPCVLGFNVLSAIQPFGVGSNIMDLEDFFVSYNILPLGGLLFVMFCSHKNGWGWHNFLEEANAGVGLSFPKKARFYMAYILPIVIAVVYLKGYYDMFIQKDPRVFTIYMVVGVLVLSAVLLFANQFGARRKAKREANETHQDN